MNRLDGKVALVSGAARGIGAESARVMVEAGAKVVITDVLEAQGEETAKILSRDGEAAFMKHDVTSEEEWIQVLDATVERFGGLNVLVNNAGVFLNRPIEETTVEEFRWLSGINLEGVFLGTKCGIRVMKETAKQQGRKGSIINLSSVAGLIGSVFAGVYSMSKGGVRLFTKSAALECGHLGYDIRVNSVHPGVIQTDMGNDAVLKLAQVSDIGTNDPWEVARGLHPLGRYGQPLDIANAICFLASDDSDFMTGSELVVDGGMTAR